MGNRRDQHFRRSNDISDWFIVIGTLRTLNEDFPKTDLAFFIVSCCECDFCLSLFIVYIFWTSRYYARMTEMKQGTPEEAEVRKQLLVSYVNWKFWIGWIKKHGGLSAGQGHSVFCGVRPFTLTVLHFTLDCWKIVSRSWSCRVLWSLYEIIHICTAVVDEKWNVIIAVNLPI